uniref:Uncharacterized protein n=1 Tax=viral metagenome TaxID=1070528 RepID=A0A6C0B3M4_9ZZZZ
MLSLIKVNNTHIYIMSTNTRRRPKTKRKIFEGRQQLQSEYLWESFKEIIDKDIFKEFYTLISKEEQEKYLDDLVSLFIQKARTRGVPKHIVINSNAYNCILQITRKRDLAPSNFRKTITQLEICAAKKLKHTRIDIIV